MVIRHSHGHVEASMSQVIPHISDSTSAEAVALWHGVNRSHLSHEMGFQQVIFEGDSLRMVQALKQDSPSLSPFSQLLEDICTRLSSLVVFEVHHIYQEANLVTHHLARLAILSSLDHIWVEDYPLFVQPFLIVEQFPL